MVMGIIVLALFLTGSPTARLLINTYVYTPNQILISPYEVWTSPPLTIGYMHACICTHDGAWYDEQKRRQHGVEHILEYGYSFSLTDVKNSSFNKPRLTATLPSTTLILHDDRLLYITVPLTTQRWSIKVVHYRDYGPPQRTRMLVLVQIRVQGQNLLRVKLEPRIMMKRIWICRKRRMVCYQ